MLDRYPPDFAGEPGSKGAEHFLRHMGSDPNLIHAYQALRPDLPESGRVIDEIADWFKTANRETNFPLQAKTPAVFYFAGKRPPV